MQTKILLPCVNNGCWVIYQSVSSKRTDSNYMCLLNARDDIIIMFIKNNSSYKQTKRSGISFLGNWISSQHHICHSRGPISTLLFPQMSLWFCVMRPSISYAMLCGYCLETSTEALRYRISGMWPIFGDRPVTILRNAYLPAYFAIITKPIELQTSGISSNHRIPHPH